jgi:hypothetical protein
MDERNKALLEELEDLTIRWRAGLAHESCSSLVSDLRRKYHHVVHGGTLREGELEQLLARCIRALERQAEGELVAAATAVIDELNPAADTLAVRRLRAVLGET